MSEKCVVCGETSRFTLFRGLTEEFKLCAEHYDRDLDPKIIAMNYGLPFPQRRFEL